ncbi:MAG: hypothetical protein M0Z64_02045 [Nitrospiraceae bacterium]|nr:hypothetical protein [Nitrospiraceae bacterium]
MQIEKILQSKGPMLSGALSKQLMKSPISASNDRQMISRASSPIEKLQLGFENNQCFVYLAEHKGSGIYWKALVDCMERHAKAYYAFINAVKYHNGFIKHDQLPAYTASPILDLKGHMNALNIIRDLLSCEILYEQDDGVLHLNNRIIDVNNFARFKAIEIAKKQVINNFNNWAKNVNLVSYNAGKTLGDRPEFGKFQWGFSAPSYVNGIGILRGRMMMPGFVIADILIGREIELPYVDFFLKKIEILRRQKNLSPFIPILICDSIENKTFKVLKEKNIFIGFIKELFGSEYLKALELLIDTITNATKIITSNPDKFIELMEKMSLLEGAYGNLKGDMFEFAVGYYYALKNKPIVIGKIVKSRSSNKNREIDVFVNSHNRLKIVECKGHNSQLSYDAMREWIYEIVPDIRGWILSQDEHRQKELTFEIWSISGFDKKALQLIEKASQNTKKYRIKFYDRSAIMLKAKANKNKKFLEIIEKYFRKT